jgi:hypothetical protein
MASKKSLDGGIKRGHGILRHDPVGELSGNREVHALAERQIVKVGKV